MLFILSAPTPASGSVNHVLISVAKGQLARAAVMEAEGGLKSWRGSADMT